MKKINIGLIVSAVILVLCISFTIVNFVAAFPTSSVNAVGNLKSSVVYTKNTERSRIFNTLYGFKNIAVDGYGMIYIGHDKGIAVYNKEHELFGEFAYEFSDFAFKIENDSELLIISSDSRLFTGGTDINKEVQKDNTTYYVKYDVNVTQVQSPWDIPQYIIEKKAISQNYHEYKSQNGFTESNVYKTKDAEYEYRPYGVLKTVDYNTDGNPRYSKLPAFVLPLPKYIIIILDCVSLALFALFFALKLSALLDKRDKRRNNLQNNAN